MGRRIDAGVRALAAALLCASGLARAEPAPLGEVFRLNPDEAPVPTHGAAQVMRAPDGRFAAVWSQWTPAGGRHLARVYSAAGVPLAPPTQVNQRDEVSGVADAAGDRDGGFVVAWSYETGEPSEPVSQGVYARRFGAGGVPLGGEFEVAPPPVSTTSDVIVSMAPNGRFGVLWFGPDTAGLYGRFYESDGAPRTGPVRLVDLTGHLERPQLLMRDDGSFVLSYSCNGDCGGHGDAFTAYLQMFDAAGQPASARREFGVEVAISSLDALPDGGFQAAWADCPHSGCSWDVWLRRFGANGAAAGPQLRINTEPASFAVGSAVDARGATAIVWLDSRLQNVLARGLDRSAQPDGEPLTVGGGQAFYPAPAASFSDDGGFIVVWVCPRDGGSTLCGRRYGEPASGAPSIVPGPSAGFGNNEVAGALGLPFVLLLLGGVRARRRRRPTGAGRTSGSPARC